MELPIRIKRWRTFRGMTQTRLAELASLSASSVCLYEGGRCEPTQENLRSLLTALNLTPARFYGRLPRAARAARKSGAGNGGIAA